VVAGAGNPETKIPTFQLLGQQLILTATCVGGKEDQDKLFEFFVDHKLDVEVKCVKMSEINAAIHDAKNNKISYRYLLEWD